MLGGFQLEFWGVFIKNSFKKHFVPFHNEVGIFFVNDPIVA